VVFKPRQGQEYARLASYVAEACLYKLVFEEHPILIFSHASSVPNLQFVSPIHQHYAVRERFSFLTPRLSPQ
jgi:hypothetical protein